MIIKKPWGYEEVIEINNKFMFKKLNLNNILQKKISETIFRYISSFRLK